MANYCFVAPILAGGVDRMHTLIKNEITNNAASHDAFLRSAGMSREQVWIQHTPMGDFAIVSYEVEDPAKTFSAIATSTHPYAVKFRNHLTAAHGIDFTKPMDMNERLLDWHAN
ncbi:MAG: hypothetical protein P4L50_23575 [Anaerolineaceae bacterium]|nr:hypothetical protein [Anaerolineaceae bacterium]